MYCRTSGEFIAATQSLFFEDRLPAQSLNANHGNSCKNESTLQSKNKYVQLEEHWQHQGGAASPMKEHTSWQSINKHQHTNEKQIDYN